MVKAAEHKRWVMADSYISVVSIGACSIGNGRQLVSCDAICILND